MNRQVKARDVEPGMRIGYEWGDGYGSITVAQRGYGHGAVTIFQDETTYVTIPSASTLTVFSEPES